MMTIKGADWCIPCVQPNEWTCRCKLVVIPSREPEEVHWAYLHIFRWGSNVVRNRVIYLGIMLIQKGGLSKYAWDDPIRPDPS